MCHSQGRARRSHRERRQNVREIKTLKEKEKQKASREKLERKEGGTGEGEERIRIHFRSWAKPGLGNGTLGWLTQPGLTGA